MEREHHIVLGPHTRMALVLPERRYDIELVDRHGHLQEYVLRPLTTWAIILEGHRNNMAVLGEIPLNFISSLMARQKKTLTC